MWQQHQDDCAAVGDRGGVVFALANKARVAWKLQDNRAAQFYITQAIQSYLESGAQFAHLNIMFQSLIAVFRSEGRNERATELLSFLRQHADKAHALEVVEEAEQKLVSLAQKLPPDLYQQALERGKSLHLRTILEQLSDELTGYSPPAYGTSQTDSLTERELKLLQEFTTEGNDPTRQIKQSFPDRLTPRELEILHLMSAGLTNREIAAQLVIGVNTVKKHITHIYGKLGVSDRIKVINRARALDLLPSSTP
jgi:DNA-binding NarL/FixJ family response regulator